MLLGAGVFPRPGYCLLIQLVDQLQRLAGGGDLVAQRWHGGPDSFLLEIGGSGRRVLGARVVYFTEVVRLLTDDLGGFLLIAEPNDASNRPVVARLAMLERLAAAGTIRAVGLPRGRADDHAMAVWVPFDVGVVADLDNRAGDCLQPARAVRGLVAGLFDYCRQCGRIEIEH